MRFKNIGKRTEAMELVTRLQDRLILHQKMVDALCSEARAGLRRLEDEAHWDGIMERGAGLEVELGHLETFLRGQVERLVGKELQRELLTFDGQVLARLGCEDVRV